MLVYFCFSEFVTVFVNSLVINFTAVCHPVDLSLHSRCLWRGRYATYTAADRRSTKPPINMASKKKQFAWVYVTEFRFYFRETKVTGQEEVAVNEYFYKFQEVLFRNEKMVG